MVCLPGLKEKHAADEETALRESESAGKRREGGEAMTQNGRGQMAGKSSETTPCIGRGAGARYSGVAILLHFSGLRRHRSCYVI